MIFCTSTKADIVDGLVAYYEFENNFLDSHGVSHGTFVGTASANFATGKFGNGIDLNGADQQINILNESAFDFGAMGTGMSISAWFRGDTFDTNWQALVTKGESSEFRLHRNNGTNNISWNAGSGGDLTPTYNVNDGAIHHIAVTHDGAASNARTEVWIDGVLRAFATNRGQIVDNNMPLMIGENPDSQNREWEGLIDDVGLWNRPLTQSEILTLWNGGAGTSIAVASIPEPTSSSLLILAGLSALGYRVRRKFASQN